MDEVDILSLATTIIPWVIARTDELYQDLTSHSEKHSKARIRKATYYHHIQVELLKIQSEFLDQPNAELIPKDLLCKVLSLLEIRIFNKAFDTNDSVCGLAQVQKHGNGVSTVLRDLHLHILSKAQKQSGWFLSLEDDKKPAQKEMIACLRVVHDDLESWSNTLSDETDFEDFFDCYSYPLPNNPTDPGLVTSLHEALCDHWKCDCTPRESHMSVNLRLAPYRNVGESPTRGPGFELLCSTHDAFRPWRETEVWIRKKKDRK
jgi:hypothetical protein